MRSRFPTTTLAASLLIAIGCGSNALPTFDSGAGGTGTGGFYGYGGTTGIGGFGTGGFGTGGFATGGFGETGGNTQPGTGGTFGQIDASVDAIGGIACPALAELTSSPAPVPPQPGCPCTRRPGVGNSYLCPMGVGQKSYAYIDSSGGSLFLIGQQSAKSNIPFELTIPPGAVNTLTLVSVEETDLPPPSGFLDWSPVYLVEPRGLTLAKVAGLQIPWSSNVSQIPSTLAIYARDENGSCGWKPLVDSYMNAGFEQASLTALGYLFVGVPSTINPSTCGADASVRD
jgi:hypothetical protein